MPTHGLQPVYPLGSFTTYYKAEEVEALLLQRAQEIEQVKAACVIGSYCRTHGFIHGAEAEELRERLGKLNNPRVNQILDDVDARDSVAWLESKQETAEAALVSSAPQPKEEPMPYRLGDHCPRCDSPAPHLHPAMQFEGEVQPCAHPFHEIPTNQNRVSRAPQQEEK